MERRWKLMSFLKSINLVTTTARWEGRLPMVNLIDPTWNKLIRWQGATPPIDSFPSIVIVADGLTDMIMRVGKKLKR